MKLKSFLAALGAVAALTVAAYAADPSGTWSYTMAMRPGGTPRTATLTLALKDGALTGTVSGRNGDTAISDASFKDNMVSFSVVREYNGNSFTIKYSGKLDGDTITGTVERPNPDGGDPVKIDWKATRSKGDASSS